MNLTNHFLVAMPKMQDPNFKGSVVYICEHNDEGAMGIVINLPIEISVGNMLDQIEIERELPVRDHSCLGHGYQKVVSQIHGKIPTTDRLTYSMPTN